MTKKYTDKQINKTTTTITKQKTREKETHVRHSHPGRGPETVTLPPSLHPLPRAITLRSVSSPSKFSVLPQPSRPPSPHYTTSRPLLPKKDVHLPQKNPTGTLYHQNFTTSSACCFFNFHLLFTFYFIRFYLFYTFIYHPILP